MITITDSIRQDAYFKSYREENITNLFSQFSFFYRCAEVLMRHIAAGSDFCDPTDANRFWDIITTACKRLFVWKKLYHVSQTMFGVEASQKCSLCFVWAFEVLLLAAGLALPPSCPTICLSATPAQAGRGSTPDWPSGAVRVLSNSPARGGQRSICSEKLTWLETTPDDCFHIENNV